MRKFLDEIENTAAKVADAAKDACEKARPAVEKGLDQAVQGAKTLYAKTDDRIERLVEEAQNAYEKAAESLRGKLNAEPFGEEAPRQKTLDEELSADVDAQVEKIRAAQQAPGAFSDYIARKYGKE